MFPASPYRETFHKSAMFEFCCTYMHMQSHMLPRWWTRWLCWLNELLMIMTHMLKISPRPW